jgi:hypothetical protein
MQGGPWAALLLAAGVYAWARHRGWLLAESEVDRSTGGYLQVIGHLEKELAYLRSAAEKKDATIQTQADQIARLMRNSDLSTHALESILREAHGVAN